MKQITNGGYPLLGIMAALGFLGLPKRRGSGALQQTWDGKVYEDKVWIVYLSRTGTDHNAEMEVPMSQAQTPQEAAQVAQDYAENNQMDWTTSGGRIWVSHVEAPDGTETQISQG